MGLGMPMRATSVALALLVCATIGLAQEGFPLDGTWRGAFGESDGGSTPVVIVMKWDGEAINGTLNPGPNSAPLQATLEPETWTIRIEGEHEGGAFVADGTLRDIGSYNRYIEGTWRQSGSEYAFRITRE